MIVTVVSGKGGVGKTQLAVNLAQAQGQLGRRVLLVDGDLSLANAHQLLGKTPRASLRHVVGGRVPRREAVLREADFDLLCGGRGPSAPADQAGFFLGLLQVLRGGVRDYDQVLVDSGAGVGPDVRFYLAVSDLAVLVVTPEATSLEDAGAVLQLASDVGTAVPFGIVVNRAGSAREAREIASELAARASQSGRSDVRLMGYVYRDGAVERALRVQVPFVKCFPDAPASRCVATMAKRWVGGAMETEAETERAAGQVEQQCNTY